MVAIIVVGFSGCQKNDNKTNNNQQQNQITLSKEESKRLKEEFENFIKEHGERVELEKVDTTGWKTYKDKKRGFEFKYPNDWVVIEKEVPQHKIYKDCYDALGDVGGCDDYNLKVTYQDTFLCLHPQNSDDNRCQIKFDEWIPQTKQVYSVMSMYAKYIPQYLQKINSGTYSFKYVLVSDHVLWNGIFSNSNGVTIKTNLIFDDERDNGIKKVKNGIMQTMKIY